MSMLHEYPNLFANGKFSVEWPAHDMATEIYGFETHFQGRNGEPVNVFRLSDGDIVPVEQLTLIARPIEYLSDEEIRELNGIDSLTKEHCEFIRMRLISRANSRDLKQVEIFFCLRKGVYIGHQSHFETGEVISRIETNKAK